ncbi:hypothetical protein [Sphingobium yanoikuyae]|uniref:Uncharacterized protein n=1 Tax=Sphingobium yanoikuyae ATCC 51230 TaxID=883163 RepID=K9CRL6_SPHYA|nr:hypothetical protein [Sphingobium yanoikuyae]EKU74598.1 hypothetical protein HMPREF9718_02126 [Sphingobium yanoikuyae ATCC 51230]WQE06519.1 hypothetical protein U0025_19810 [Sphingobium yanoikuyae]
MTKIYESDDWHDSPGGWRSTIKNVVPERWISVVEGLARCKAACPDYPQVAHDMLVWRLQNCLIAAKAAVIEVRHGEDDDIGRYHHIPVIEEWSDQAWASINSEVWAAGNIRTIENRFGTLRRIQYKDVAIDRDGLDALVKHLAGLIPTATKPKPKPPSEFVWSAWVQERKARGALPSVEALLEEAQIAFPENKITQAAARRAFGGGRPGPRKHIP